MARQLSFLPKPRLDHGGDIAKGRRKQTRPFDPKRPLHIVLRSSRAKGKWSLLHPANAKRVDTLIRGTARKYGVRVYRFVNVGNHIHLLLRAKKRPELQGFLRETAGVIAFQITGAKKTNPKGKFWDSLVYSRVVSWGKELKTLKSYLIKNLFEANGLLNRKQNPKPTLILLNPDP